MKRNYLKDLKSDANHDTRQYPHNPKRYIAEEEEGDLGNVETDFHSQLKEEK